MKAGVFTLVDMAYQLAIFDMETPIYEQAVVKENSLHLIGFPSSSPRGWWGREGCLKGTLGALWVPFKALLPPRSGSLFFGPEPLPCG
jgi:hypothetical protein